MILSGLLVSTLRGVVVGNLGLVDVDSFNPRLLALGVYAARARVGVGIRPDGVGHANGARTFDAVCNVGVKPTVEESGPVGLEVHLFGHDGSDLYGERVRVELLGRIRAERRFPSLDALRAQIASDAAAARELLARAPER